MIPSLSVYSYTSFRRVFTIWNKGLTIVSSRHLLRYSNGRHLFVRSKIAFVFACIGRSPISVFDLQLPEDQEAPLPGCPRNETCPNLYLFFVVEHCVPPSNILLRKMKVASNLSTKEFILSYLKENTFSSSVLVLIMDMH